MARELWVGPGEARLHLHDTAKVAQAGDAIRVRTGTSKADFATSKAAASIAGVGPDAPVTAFRTSASGSGWPLPAP